jgi:cyclophilin family peptidyl-prolyl cis-trans isomerase
MISVVMLASCTGGSLTDEVPDEFPKVIFNTTEGSFTMQLFTRNAPKTCAQFLEWCKGVKQNDGNVLPVYQGLNFYNIEPGMFIQTGDPFNTGLGQMQYLVTYEKTYKTSVRGTVFMPNGGTSQNSSIICVLLKDNPKIGERFTVFAQVTQGLEICDLISNAPTRYNEKEKLKIPTNPVKIITVQVVEQ